MSTIAGAPAEESVRSGWVLSIALPCLAVTMIMAIPVYSDEIAIHMLKASSVGNGLMPATLFPQCTSTWAAKIPESHIPGALVWAALYPSREAWMIRLSGLCVAWMAIGLWYLTLRHACPTSWWANRVWAVTISLSLIGVMPFLLGLTRGEQQMLLSISVLCLLAVVSRQRLLSPTKSTLALAVALVASSMLFFANPKSLFFLPVAAIAVWTIGRGAGLVLRLGATGLLAIMGYQTYSAAAAYVSCPEDPFVAQRMGSQGLDMHQPVGAIVSASLANLRAAPAALADRVGFAESYQSDWLIGVHNWAIAPAGAVTSWLAYAILVGAPAVVVILSSSRVIRRGFDVRDVLALGLVVGVVGHLAWYPERILHFYVPGLVIPALMLALGLSLSASLSLIRWCQRARLCDVGAALCIFAAVTNGVLCVATYVPPEMQIQRQGETQAKQQLSTPIWFRGALDEDLAHASAECQIAMDEPHLVVDGSAYTGLTGIPRSIFVFYVDPHIYGSGIEGSLGDFLRGIGSPGVVVHSENLPEVLKDTSERYGSVACVSAKQLDED